MDPLNSNRDVQLKIVYGTAVAVGVYFLCTVLIPWLYHRYQLDVEKRRVISTLKEEAPSVDAVMSELRDYKSNRPVPVATDPKCGPRNPTFALPRSGSVAGKAVQDQASTAAETVRAQHHTAPKFQLSSVSSLSSGERSRTTAPSPDAQHVIADNVGRGANNSVARVGDSTLRSPHLSTFAEDSIEARLHRSAQQRAWGDAYTPEEMQQRAEASAEERALRERQNAEFRASEERDRQRLEEERKKQEHAMLVEARRVFLADTVLPEPDVKSGDGGDAVTLQFRFRDAGSSNQMSAGSSSKNARIKRRFSRTRATAEDLLLYVESLELRPLLSAEVELCLDYPTRVINKETDCSKTLEQLGITADSVVWVSFKGD